MLEPSPQLRRFYNAISRVLETPVFGRVKPPIPRYLRPPSWIPVFLPIMVLSLSFGHYLAASMRDRAVRNMATAKTLSDSTAWHEEMTRWSRLGTSKWPLYVVFLGLCLSILYAILRWRRIRRTAIASSGQLCPDCGYLLVGLPDTGSCPECGRAYVMSEVQARWMAHVTMSTKPTATP